LKSGLKIQQAAIPLLAQRGYRPICGFADHGTGVIRRLWLIVAFWLKVEGRFQPPLFRPAWVPVELVCGRLAQGPALTPCRGSNFAEFFIIDAHLSREFGLDA
jgi:hypothetical protein